MANKNAFGKVISGQSVVSKYPLKDHKRIVLERVANEPFYRGVFYLERLAQVVKVVLNGKEVVLINIHLEAFDKEARVKQFEEVVKIFNRYKNIYPSLVFYNVFKNLSKKYKLKLNYQIIQVEIGKLNVNIEQELSLKGKSLIIFELNKYFKKDVEFLIFDQVQLHSKKGKLVDFISKID